MTKPPRPTDTELAILRILWERGASTVRQVHDALSRERPAAYTTALKMLQIMTEKGLVRRDVSDRTHIYQSKLSEEQTQRQLVRDLVDRAFGGSASKLVMQALPPAGVRRPGARRDPAIDRRQPETAGRHEINAIGEPDGPACRAGRRLALLHFIWQGAHRALTALALGALRKGRPTVRYVVGGDRVVADSHRSLPSPRRNCGGRQRQRPRHMRRGD